MAFSRQLGVIGICGISWLVAVGCGDDDGKKAAHASDGGEGGEAGEAPIGGKAAAGSSTVVAGAGAGGQSNGGSAGEAGATPVAGGGAGGAGGLAAGGAGEGGEGGVPAAVLKQCANECEIDDDCLIAGSDTAYTCDLESKRCVDPGFTACASADDCVPSAGFWLACATTDGCDEGQACVAWQGQGYCTYLNVDGCLQDIEESRQLPEFGAVDSTLNVCIPLAACSNNSCVPACETTGCEVDGPTCNTTSHLCECTTNDECQSDVCGADHHCAQCATDADCQGEGGTGLDVCIDGKCGCSSSTVCLDPTAAGVPVCE